MVTFLEDNILNSISKAQMCKTQGVWYLATSHTDVFAMAALCTFFITILCFYERERYAEILNNNKKCNNDYTFTQGSYCKYACDVANELCVTFVYIRVTSASLSQPSNAAAMYKRERERERKTYHSVFFKFKLLTFFIKLVKFSVLTGKLLCGFYVIIIHVYQW